ncbi:MAG: peptidoglycan DD-metalloendopeptidase family protein [Candidatus Aminicenantales bacterium]
MKKKKRRILFLVLSVFSVLVAFSFIFVHLAKKRSSLRREESSPPAAEAAADALVETKVILQKGMTLSDLLSRYHFSPAEIHRLREQTKPVFSLNRIKAGQEICFVTDADGRMKSMKYQIDDLHYLLIQIKDENYAASIEEYAYETRVDAIWGTIEDNLVSAFNEKNEGNKLALDMAECFAWDIDFYTDLRQGDSFRVIFEKKYLDGQFTGYGNILAAEFVNQGKKFQAFRYVYPDTKKWDYFDGEGKSLRKEFLKSPIKYGRITSRFSLRRLHPIRKVYRPHFGVDYSAPIGTPVQATADGTVTLVGWNGASGRMVRIRHANNYETMYLHLQKYFVKKGDPIKGGETVGTVGSSGESTGPHLDYRIKFRGSYINPLAWRFKPVAPVRPEYLEDYKNTVAKFSFFLNLPLFIWSRLY